MKNLIKKYNNENAILVISSYPDKKQGIKNLNAVAWYSCNLLREITRNKKQKFVVLAENTGSQSKKATIVKKDNILVVHCWRKDNPLLFFDLFRWLKKFNRINIVNIQFEFNMFGGISSTAFFVPFLLITKILKKKIVLTLHQVVLDINALSGHLNIKKGGSLSKLFNLSLAIFYITLGYIVNRVIVLENEFRIRLSKYISNDKIAVVPISTNEDVKFISKVKARKKLGLPKGEFVVLCFGFITWYKGIDWLAKQKLEKRTKLIIAGGESPTLKNKTHYKKFYNKVLKHAEKSGNTLITGFIPESEIPLYFSACDLVIFPYRVMISSSGPLSWALSFKKPFLLSNVLKSYSYSKDFNNSLNEAGLEKTDLFFSLKGDFLKKKIHSLDKRDIIKLSNFVALLAQKRNSNYLASLYLYELVTLAQKETVHEQSKKLASQPVYTQ